MTGLLILHAPGDETPVQQLSVRLAAQHPVCIPMGEGCDRFRFGPQMSLLLVWSHRAFALGLGAALGEMCLHHAGLVFICLTDEAPLPEELDDSTYRFINLSTDDETLRCARRAHALVASAARERHFAQLADLARRRRLPIGRAFGGGALAGFTASVALLGAAGATADQLTQEEAAARSRDAAAVSNVAPLSEIRGAPEHEPWMDFQPAPPSPDDEAATRQKLQAVAARMAALQEADRRAQRDRILARTAPRVEQGRPPPQAHEPAFVASHPLWRPAETLHAATTTSDVPSTVPLGVETANASTEATDPNSAPSTEEGGAAFSMAEYSETIGAARRIAAIGPPRAEDIESF